MNRQFLIKAVTFLGGLYFFLEFLLPAQIFGVQFDYYSDQISKGFNAVVVMSVGLGLINLFAVHGSRIAFMRRGWMHSAALMIGLFAMTAIMIADWAGSSELAVRRKKLTVLADFSKRISDDLTAQTVDRAKSRERNELLKRDVSALLADADVIDVASATPADQERLKNFQTQIDSDKAKLAGLLQALESPNSVNESDFSGNAAVGAAIRTYAQHSYERSNLLYKYSLRQRLYKLLYDGFFVSLGSAMFALLGFYMAGAAYRAFRIRSFESGLMMAAALLVMLGQIPFGLWIWEGFSDIRLWLLSTPSTAAFRAIKLGAAIAGLVMAFRMWLSIESDTVGGRRS